MAAEDVPRIPLRVSQGTVVASVQTDFQPPVLSRFRDDLLETVQRSRASGVIIDLSAVAVLDPGDLAGIRATMDMVSLLGARTVLAGMRPGVISALIDLEADVDGIHAVLTLDDAFARLEALKAEEDDADQSVDENPDS